MQLSTPYRDPPTEVRPTAREEMDAAVRFLVQYRKCKPVLVGGALWSWAAGNPVRDVDFNIEDTLINKWRLRGLGTKGTQQLSDGGTVSAGYSYQLEEEMVTLRVRRCHLSTGTPMDLVFTPWATYNATGHFDYRHCQVAYRHPGGVITKGAQDYSSGVLTSLHKHARSSERVLAKVEPSLWGNPDAPHALGVFYRRCQVFTDA